MRKVEELVGQHEKRIATELVATLRTRAFDLSLEQTEALVGSLIRSLRDDLAHPGGNALARWARANASRFPWFGVQQICAALIRLGQSVRTIAMLEIENPRTQALVSAVIDRAIAGAIDPNLGGWDLKVTDDELPLQTDNGPESGSLSETIEASVLAVALRKCSSVPHRESLATSCTLQCLLADRLRSRDGLLVLNEPTLMVALFDASVAANGLNETAELALAVLADAGFSRCSAGLSCGPVTTVRSQGSLEAVGVPLQEAMALALNAAERHVVIDRKHGDPIESRSVIRVELSKPTGRKSPVHEGIDTLRALYERGVSHVDPNASAKTIRAEAMIAMSQVHLVLNRREAASRAAAKALQLTRRSGPATLVVRAMLTRAKADLSYESVDRHHRAIEELREAAHLAHSAGASRWEGECLELLSDALAELDPESSRRSAERAKKLFDSAKSERKLVETKQSAAVPAPARTKK